MSFVVQPTVHNKEEETMTLDEIEIPTLLAHCRWIYHHKKYGQAFDKEDMMSHMKTENGRAILRVLLGEPTKDKELAAIAESLYRLATVPREERQQELSPNEE